MMRSTACEAVVAQFIHGPMFCHEPATHVVVFDSSSDSDCFLACDEHLTDETISYPVEFPENSYSDSDLWDESNPIHGQFS